MGLLRHSSFLEGFEIFICFSVDAAVATIRCPGDGCHSPEFLAKLAVNQSHCSKLPLLLKIYSWYWSFFFFFFFLLCERKAKKAFRNVSWLIYAIQTFMAFDIYDRRAFRLPSFGQRRGVHKRVIDCKIKMKKRNDGNKINRIVFVSSLERLLRSVRKRFGSSLGKWP